MIRKDEGGNGSTTRAPGNVGIAGGGKRAVFQCGPGMLSGALRQDFSAQLIANEDSVCSCGVLRLVVINHIMLPSYLH